LLVQILNITDPDKKGPKPILDMSNVLITDLNNEHRPAFRNLSSFNATQAIKVE